MSELVCAELLSFTDGRSHLMLNKCVLVELLWLKDSNKPQLISACRLSSPPAVPETYTTFQMCRGLLFMLTSTGFICILFVEILRWVYVWCMGSDRDLCHNLPTKVEHFSLMEDPICPRKDNNSMHGYMSSVRLRGFYILYIYQDLDSSQNMTFYELSATGLENTDIVKIL